MHLVPRSNQKRLSEVFYGKDCEVGAKWGECDPGVGANVTPLLVVVVVVV